jgi:hypothetical protein
MSQLMSHDSKDLIQHLAKMSREGGARQSMPRKRKSEPLPQRSTFKKESRFIQNIHKNKGTPNFSPTDSH